MKKYALKLLIIAVFALLFVVMAQSAHAMGLMPWGHQSGGGADNVVGVPEPLTALSLLAIGVAGVSGYLLIRKKKDK